MFSYYFNGRSICSNRCGNGFWSALQREQRSKKKGIVAEQFANIYLKLEPLRRFVGVCSTFQLWLSIRVSVIDSVPCFANSNIWWSSANNFEGIFLINFCMTLKEVWRARRHYKSSSWCAESISHLPVWCTLKYRLQNWRRRFCTKFRLKSKGYFRSSDGINKQPSWAREKIKSFVYCTDSFKVQQFWSLTRDFFQ